MLKIKLLERIFFIEYVINIELPPLRKENDIVYLSNHFLSVTENSKQIDNSALDFIKEYDWPEM